VLERTITSDTYQSLSKPVHQLSKSHQKLDLEVVNENLTTATAEDIIRWANTEFAEHLVMSTSFGIQSAVMLHLVTQVVPNLPIIWIDTGYLPKETYLFADELTQRLNLNLCVYQSDISPARMEAMYGKLWEKKDLESLNLYDRIRKVEPMQRALKDLQAKAWLAGLRQNQTQFRKQLDIVNKQGDQYKILPILKWTSRDIYEYLTKYDLPYHPYFDQGYVSVGDWHSSRPLSLDDENERDTRFHGVKQECGLHLPSSLEEAQSLDSSQL
jgi:phosphoadenosine phosphosulfate reductase